MARSASRARVTVVRQSYFWPDQQLNFWIIIMLATGGVLVGTFAAFVTDQQHLGGLGIPWYVEPKHYWCATISFALYTYTYED